MNVSNKDLSLVEKKKFIVSTFVRADLVTNCKLLSTYILNWSKEEMLTTDKLKATWIFVTLFANVASITYDRQLF